MASDGPGNGQGGRMDGGGMGGPGEGRGGGRFAPVAASATAADIFQQKCQGCHGERGEGLRGPNITKEGARPDAELFKIIHDGRGKMPAFGNQMTEAQVNSVVAYVKQLGSSK